MQITFLGVGEACDPCQPNTSILLAASEHHFQILLDCGFTTPHLYFKKHDDPDELDALWISHFHGDHFLGIPLLLLRYWEMERNKPLIITGQNGIQKRIYAVMELAYPGFMKKIKYPIDYIEINSGVAKEIGCFVWHVAESSHSQRNLALRLDYKDKSIFYSGDGKATRDTAQIAENCDLIIHEAYNFDAETPGHYNIQQAIEFARQAQARQLALVHLAHFVRKSRELNIQSLVSSPDNLEIIIPESGDTIVI